jgi:nucleotide-binding universal stress UspA family protein
MLQGPVLVGTDLTEAAEAAMREGAQLAHALDGHLIVCHVIPELVPDGSLFHEFRRANLKAEEWIIGKAREAVQAHVESLLPAQTSLRVDIVLDSGSPHIGLLRHAMQTHAGVVVTGPGLSAMEVARHAEAAVLVARSPRGGPVVGATDFSDPSLPAVHMAASEARRRGVPLHLLHAFDVGLFALGPGHAPAAALPYLAGHSAIALEGLDELCALGTERLTRTLHEIGGGGEVAVVPGKAVDVIVQYAERVGAELVVVGTHGRSGLARLTLGSTAGSVIEAAPCSVLVVRLAREH